MTEPLHCVGAVAPCTSSQPQEQGTSGTTAAALEDSPPLPAVGANPVTNGAG